MKRQFTIVLLSLAAIACESGSDDRHDDSNSTDDVPGQLEDQEGCGSILHAVVRDFPDSHPDFHYTGTDTATLGMVAPDLGSNNKPVSASGEMYSTHLDEWYRTISGVNLEFSEDIRLTETEPGRWVYDNSAFFPLSPSEGYGADIDGESQNFLFTTELALDFIYEPGQVFTFRGDDDLWVFISRKLAIDLGGIHSQVEGSVNIDQFSEENGLNLQSGHKYPMHIFHAERNPTESNFRIETTIGCFKIPVI